MILAFNSCQQKKDAKQLNAGTDSLIAKENYYLDFDKNNFSHEPKILLERKYFTVKIHDESIYELVGGVFRVNIIQRRKEINFWHREYNFGAEPIAEYRGYSGIDNFNYLIICRYDTLAVIYIKWRNIEKDEFIVPTNIGKFTIFLETNLPSDVLLRFFPDIQCAINVKQPKSIEMPLRSFYPSFIYDDPKSYPMKYSYIRPKFVY